MGNLGGVDGSGFRFLGVLTDLPRVIGRTGNPPTSDNLHLAAQRRLVGLISRGSRFSALIDDIPRRVKPDFRLPPYSCQTASESVGNLRASTIYEAEFDE